MVTTKQLLVIVALLSVLAGYGQQKINTDSVKITPVKSAISYEALTQFFQTSISAGHSGSFTFRSSLFGIQKLFSKRQLDLSDYYIAHKAARNIEFAISVNKNDLGNYDILQGGFKYAIVNHRSKSDVNFLRLKDVATKIQDIGNVLYQAQREFQLEIDRLYHGNAKLREQNRIDAALKKYSRTLNEKDLPDRMQKIADSLILISKGMSADDFFKQAQMSYDIAAKKIDQKGLLTLSINPGYGFSKHRLDSSSAVLQYLKGFGNYARPWNIDISLIASLIPDTLTKSANLSRSVGTLTIGLNKALINTDQLDPILEFELAVEDDYVRHGLYVGEKTNTFNVNTILRVHISREIAVPVKLQFDLTRHLLHGFLAVSWNLEHRKKNA